MRKVIIVAALLSACQPASNSTNSDQEDWISLFNGVNLSGWDVKIAGYPLNENYLETFIVEDSMIRISYDNYEEFNDAFGHMYYQTPYSYYKMRFDYRFTGEQLKGGAS